MYRITYPERLYLSGTSVTEHTVGKADVACVFGQADDMEVYLSHVAGPTYRRKPGDILNDTYRAKANHSRHIDGNQGAVYKAVGNICDLEDSRIVGDIIVGGVEVGNLRDINTSDEIGALCYFSRGINAYCDITLGLGIEIE